MAIKEADITMIIQSMEYQAQQAADALLVWAKSALPMRRERLGMGRRT
jgi:hypothetical protein